MKTKLVKTFEDKLISNFTENLKDQIHI